MTHPVARYEQTATGGVMAVRPCPLLGLRPWRVNSATAEWLHARLLQRATGV